MENRIATAVRILLGKPIIGIMIDGAVLLDRNTESEFDHSKKPPFDLAFGGVVANIPPVRIIADNGLRVCIFPEIESENGKLFRWLTLELRGDGKWHHLITMHESRLAIMQSVLADVDAYLQEER